MAVNVDRFAEYLRTVATDPETLQMYIDAAKDKAQSAGVGEFKNNAHYDLFIYALAAMYYDNRGMSFTTAEEESARRIINSFVLELRYAKDNDIPGESEEQEKQEA